MALKRKTFERMADKFVNNTFEDFTKSAVINQLVTVDDDQGGRSEAWELFANIKCFVFPEQGAENVDAGRYFSNQNFTFQFQPVQGVTTKMQIVYDGEEYGITSIEDVVEASVWMKVATQWSSAS